MSCSRAAARRTTSIPWFSMRIALASTLMEWLSTSLCSPCVSCILRSARCGMTRWMVCLSTWRDRNATGSLPSRASRRVTFLTLRLLGTRLRLIRVIVGHAVGVEQAGQQGFSACCPASCVALITWRRYMTHTSSPVNVGCLLLQGVHLLPEGFGVTTTECVNEDRCPVL